MLNLVGKLAIVRSKTFLDRFLLVYVTKETPKSITVRHWNKRAIDWERETRRNDKEIVKILHNQAETVSADQLNRLAHRMESIEANIQERIRNTKLALVQDMQKVELK